MALHCLQPKVYGRDELTITLRVEVLEALTEFERIAIDSKGTIGSLLSFDSFGRKTGSIDAKEIADACMFNSENPPRSDVLT